MNTKQKKQKLFKILSYVGGIAPLVTFLIVAMAQGYTNYIDVHARITNENFTIKVDDVNVDKETIEVLKVNDKELIFTTKAKATVIEFGEVVDLEWGGIKTSNDVLTLHKGITFSLKAHDFKISDLTQEKYKTMQLVVVESKNTPQVFFISFGTIIGVVWFVLIVLKEKMRENMRKNWKLAVLVSGITITLVLFLLSSLISDVFNVFLYATLGWVNYLIFDKLSIEKQITTKNVKDLTDMV